MATASPDMQLNQFVLNTILAEVEARARGKRLYLSEREEISTSTNLNHSSAERDN